MKVNGGGAQNLRLPRRPVQEAIEQLARVFPYKSALYNSSPKPSSSTSPSFYLSAVPCPSSSTPLTSSIIFIVGLSHKGRQTARQNLWAVFIFQNLPQLIHIFSKIAKTTEVHRARTRHHIPSYSLQNSQLSIDLEIPLADVVCFDFFFGAGGCAGRTQ